MRKFIAIIIGLFSLFFLTIMEVSAEEISYRNLITDETTIVDDFKLLNMNIEEYYQPSYNYEKWYIVGMSEAYVDPESYDIQTYFYIYNPISPREYEYYDTEEEDGAEYYNKIESFGIKYVLNNRDFSMDASLLSINYEHHLYKIKAFTYTYRDRAEISVLEIHNNMTIGIRSKSNESTFKAKCNHSKINGLSVELSFSTTLIIDEFTVVEVEIHQDDNFFNRWDFAVSGKIPSVLVYFYNFNFPEHIEYDSVEYAKFQYDYLTVYEKIWLDMVTPTTFVPSEEYASKNEKTIKSREKVISEYNNSSRTLRVNQHSQEMSFPTFYLGNRVQNQQLGNLKISDNLRDSFNYDCSILLESTSKTSWQSSQWGAPNGMSMYYRTLDYTTIDKVEMIELHYKNDGILYKCQVVSLPVDNEDFEKGDAAPDKSWWEKLLLWLGKNTLKLLHITATLPEWIYMIIGVVEVLVALVVFISLLPSIIGAFIKLITLPSKIIKS